MRLDRTVLRFRVFLRRRRVASIAVALGGALFFASTASATTTNYWGYNNMTSSNPSAGSGACPGNAIAGIACSGWNYWDRSQIDYNSGSATIRFAMNNPGSADYFGNLATYAKVWTLIRTDWNAAHPNLTIGPYNRAACLWISGTYAYIQCRAIIF
jgi:hypothetical protein